MSWDSTAEGAEKGVAGTASPSLDNLRWSRRGGRAEDGTRSRREQRGETGQEPFLAKFLNGPTQPKGKTDRLTESEVLRGGLPPFMKNRSSRLMKAPKLYFTDSGLAAHLAGITMLEPGGGDLLRGALFETY